MPGERRGVAGDDGSFGLTSLVAGKYRLEAGLPNDKWFIKKMSATSKDSETSKSANLHRDIVTLKSGERAEGITIAVSYGGAVIQGRLLAAPGTKVVHNSLRVFLVPTDDYATYDVFQYSKRPFRMMVLSF